MEENNNVTTKKGSKKGLWAVFAILIIAIVAGLAYYFLRPNATPKEIFVGGINSVFESSTKKLGEDVKKVNTTVTLSGNIESSNEEVQQIAKYINEGKLTYNVQLDTEAKKALINLVVNYQNENLLNGKLYYANGDNNIYVFVQDLFDKYFKFDMKSATDDGEGLEVLDQLFSGNTSTPYGKVDTKKVASIIRDAISNNLKDEYFSKGNVNELTKNTMKLTVKELKTVAKNIVSSLKDNQEFLNCFEKKDQVKDLLEDTIDEFDDLEEELDNNNLEVSIYTKGVKNEVDKLEAKVDLPESKQLTMSLVETEKNKYELNADVPELGKVKLNIEVKEEANTQMENVDVSNSVDINNMTQADQLKMLGNLMNMKIYQYLAPLMQGGM